jgi:hypothetical protein
LIACATDASSFNSWSGTAAASNNKQVASNNKRDLI